MKKLFACLLTLSLLLCACSAAPESDPALMEYPGLRWGMTIDEVLSARNLSADAIHYETTDIPEEGDSQQYWEYVMLFQNGEVFGLEATAVIYTFHDYSMTGEQYVLVAMDACFPEDTNTAALAQSITERYGEQETEAVSANWYSSSGEILLQTYAYEEEYVWESEASFASVLREDQAAIVHERYCAAQSSGSADKILPTQEQLMEVFSYTPACSIKLTPYFNEFMAKTGMELSEEQRAMDLTNCRLNLTCFSLDWKNQVEQMIAE